MLLTIKLVLLGGILLLYTMVNCFVIALGQISESQTEEEAQEGSKSAKKILKYIENEKGEQDRVLSIKKFLMMALAGFAVLSFSSDMRIALCSLFNIENFYGILAFNLVGALIIIAIIGLCQFFIGEVLAKVMALKNPEKSLKNLMPITSLCIAIIKPVFVVLEFFWQKISGAFGTNPDFDEEVTEENILQLVDDAEESGVLEEGQKELINNIFEFDDTAVHEVMNHRTDIVAVEITDKLEDVLKIAIDEGFSRIPVFEDDLDNIVGIVYVKDLLKYVGKKLPERVSLRSIMREAYHIPRTKRCSELFEEFTEKRIQMAIVIDEYGGTSGIITFEDLIEEIFGNIQDEYDDEEEEIAKLNETTFKIDGACDIEEVEDMLGISFPEGDYDTLGGFMLFSLGIVPKDGEKPSIEEKGYRFTALKVEDRRIEQVKAEKLPEIEEE